MKYYGNNEYRMEPYHFPAALSFTPAEWRRLLDSPTFLNRHDNSYSVPRRLMGLPVRIVPDHHTQC